MFLKRNYRGAYELLLYDILLPIVFRMILYFLYMYIILFLLYIRLVLPYLLYDVYLQYTV